MGARQRGWFAKTHRVSRRAGRICPDRGHPAGGVPGGQQAAGGASHGRRGPYGHVSRVPGPVDLLGKLPVIQWVGSIRHGLQQILDWEVHGNPLTSSPETRCGRISALGIENMVSFCDRWSKSSTFPRAIQASKEGRPVQVADLSSK